MPTAMEYDLHDATTARDLEADVFEAYDAVFGADGDLPAWRASVWEPHRARAGFRLAVARDRGGLAGFGWGYTGERGQYWPDLVVEALPELLDWVGGHFELVELAVRDRFRGGGAGRRLHDLLLDGLPHDRALLGTSSDPADPAVRLYRSRGWVELGQLAPGRQVMGRRLR
jgi:ribosomal protein S18 acetylase RimI-like enzyme